MQDLVPPKAYVLPTTLRAELSRAFGPVVSTEFLKDAVGDAPVVAVGDQVSLSCKEAGIVPRLIVVDFRTRRGAQSPAYIQALGSWGDKAWHVVNAAGVLTRESWQAVREALAHDGPYPARIVVDGEEDLLGIPCFLEARDGTKVLYGMPGQGICVVTIDAAFRRQVRKILAGFTVA
jgi:GTP-dependent dephospho-CoA kinase